jgi:hypothetical protein
MTRSNSSRKCQALGILLDFNVNARTEDEHQRSCLKGRDGNSGTGNQYSVGTQPDGYGYDFLPVGETRTRPEPRRVQVFSLHVDNPSGTQNYVMLLFLS